jgi:hypothetical protein
MVVYDVFEDSFTAIETSEPLISVPDMNDAGDRVVWQSFDGNYHTFYFDSAGGEAQPLTDAASKAEIPRISGNGNTVAFQSLADLDPSLPHDPGREIYLVDVDTGVIRGITSTPNPQGLAASSTDPRINHDGTIVAFYSTGAHDPNADNSDGDGELFLFRDDGSRFEQITDYTGMDRVSRGDISGDGNRVVYALNRLGPTGRDDPATVSEIYLWSENAGTQLINSLPGWFTLGEPLLSGDGDRVLLRSTAHLDPEAPPPGEFSQLFVLDIPTGAITRASGEVRVGILVNSSAINGDGTRIVFHGLDEELSNEIYLASCPLDRDGDGIADDIDPDAIVAVVEVLPDSAFRAAGHRTAILAQLAAVEHYMLDGQFDEAAELLENLRKHVDGCGLSADKNDWVVGCAEQIELRQAIDAVLKNL